MSDRKSCVLESAEPGATRTPDASVPGTSHHTPCALLCADAPPPAQGTADGAVEDESADPVGDGHSDAEWAARHGRNDPA